MSRCLSAFQFDREKSLGCLRAGSSVDEEDAEILLDFLIHCTERFSSGGSVAEAFGKEAGERGRPRNSERDRLIFAFIQQQIQNDDLSVSKAVACTQQSLSKAEVEGLDGKVVLSVSAIRTIYYKHVGLKQGPGAEQFSEGGQSSAAPASAEDLLERLGSDDVKVRRHAIRDLALKQQKGLKRVLGSKLILLFARTTGIEVDTMQYDLALLGSLTRGKSPNEAFRWDDDS
jgi:hypothetical protein